MPLLIDGYNLLHVTGIFGRGHGPGTLERSRRALLNFLAESLDDGERPSTTIVFDAADPPPGLPRSLTFRDMRVRYATPYASADELIEELIAADNAPRKLTVVSGDHRLHRAARRRRATAIDSDLWYARLVETRRLRNLLSPPPAAKPDGPLAPDQVEFWLRKFGAFEAITDPQHLDTANESTETSAIESKTDEPGPSKETASYNPFPPDYAEDLFDE